MITNRYNVDYVIYFYMFVCIVVLAYNVIYILQSNFKERQNPKRIEKWKKYLKELDVDSDIKEKKLAHEETVLREKLSKIDELICFNDAIRDSEFDKMRPMFFEVFYDDFLYLAGVYSEKEPMERAYFADTIRCAYSGKDIAAGNMLSILLGYMENSTVFCREMVLRTLYEVGTVSSVERAFSFLNDRELYHNPKLLSDGLMTFRGDKNALASRLWEKSGNWSESMQVSIIQFITTLGMDMKEAFFSVLLSTNATNEIKFAIIRYFQKNTYPPAGDKLISYVNDYHSAQDELAIIACSALSSYKGAMAIEALKKGLSSTNWYVRQNAASTLVRYDLPVDELKSIYSSSDRYGREMLEYVSGMSFREEEQ